MKARSAPYQHPADTLQRRAFVMGATVALGLLLITAALALVVRGRLSGAQLLLWLLLTGPVSFAVASVVWLMVDSLGHTVVHLLTSDQGAPHVYDFSEQQALIMAGRIPEAEASYRRYIDDHPGEIDGRLRLGALLMEKDRNLTAAEGLFLEARILGGTASQEATLGNALIDLHTARGDNAGLRAELARYGRMFPLTRAGAQARARLRAMVQESPQPE